MDVRGQGPLDVIVVGGLNTDYVARGEGLPRSGETLNGRTFFQGAGGKGANQAVAVARLGARAAMIGAVGADERGEALVAQLQAEGVDTRFVRAVPDAVTGVALIHVDERGEKQIMAVLGANDRPTAPDVVEACRSLAPARVLLTQFELPLEPVAAALRWARETGVCTVLDPAPAIAVPDAVLSLVDFIKPNAREAEVLTGTVVNDRATARRAAEQLLARGVRVVAVQAGDEGNLLVWRDGEQWLPRLPVRSVDATGAGDAFAAALAVAVARGASIEEAGRLANAAAAHATTKLGAQEGLATEAQLQTLLQQFGR